MDLADSVKETFEACALTQKIELYEIPKLSDLKQVGLNYDQNDNMNELQV